MFASVLVPLDGSQFAEAALPAALHLVRRSNGVLHLVRVRQSPALLPAETPIVLDPAWLEAVRAEETAYLASIAEQVAASSEARCVARLLDGTPADAIAEYAHSERIEFIAMASHGRGGASRFWLGSVADALVRRSATPVLLIRPPEDEIARVVPPTVRNVLLPLDGSELALGIVPIAESFARAMDARITLLRVIPTMAGVGVFGLVPLPQLAAEAAARANSELGELASTLRAHGIDATPVVVQSPSVAPAILEYARQSDVDAIAIATHGRGGLGRAALGSVADKVVRGTDLPVLSFRPLAARSASTHAAA